MNSLLQLAAACRIPIIDYQRQAVSGLLIGSGAGTMLAVMDRCPCFRYCFDIDEARAPKLGWFLQAIEPHCSPLALCGWFSLTDPGPIAAAIASLANPSRVLIYAQAATAIFPESFPDLSSFIAAANSRGFPCAPAARRSFAAHENSSSHTPSSVVHRHPPL